MNFAGSVSALAAGTDESGAARMSGPRIYAILPALAGPVTDWRRHAEHAAALGFDWLLLAADPSDPHQHHMTLRPDARHGLDDETMRAFVAAAHGAGLKVMAEIVPVLARDPGQEFTGGSLDPRDPGQLPPLLPDLGDPRVHDEVIASLAAEIARARAAGIDGFCCRYAHLPPAGFWRALREPDRGALFLADALGATPAERRKLHGAGFDLIFNAACWWDFAADWLLDEQAALAAIAPSVAFPEDPAGPRLRERLAWPGLETLEAVHRARYLFAASFSHGVLLPMGYEYVGHGRDDAAFDITAFIAEVNRRKAACAAIGGTGAALRLSAPGAPVTVLARLDAGTPAASTSAAILCINPHGGAARAYALERAAFVLGERFDAFAPMATSCMAGLGGGAPSPSELMQPFEARLLLARPYEARTAPPSAAASEQRIHALSHERVAIEAIRPAIDHGRFPVKRLVGDSITITADIFTDGHESLAAVVRLRQPGEEEWSQRSMRHDGNDAWSATLQLARPGRYAYEIAAWRDGFAGWRADTLKKRDAGLPLDLEIMEGVELVEQAAALAETAARALLNGLLDRLAEDAEGRLELLMSDEALSLMRQYGPRAYPVSSPRHELVVERRAAGFSAWYELMPRSQSNDARRHGTFDDVIARLPYVRDLGFDVLYFPPIHPIGTTHRKGPNNSLQAGPDDPGSPYAIGGEEGGHTALHPELGSFDDFARLVAAARDHGLEIALDFAIQCSPDHPWIKEHPEWFDWRADGSIKHAENPPKKYEDIVNVRFYRAALPSVWLALRDVVLFWAEHGVRIFRVDNPHTKPFPFWEWMIADVQARHPDIIFLSEAFTRPKVMKRLAKAGFSQSYSYFTWRTGKQELTDYLTELTGPDSDAMRPNFFANTPDINPFHLQTGGRAAFQARLVLAATLAGCYGIYNGFELCEAAALPGREEYLDSEKYQLRAWDWDRPGNIKEDVRLINAARRNNPALWQFANLTFLDAWNDAVIAYYKITEAGDNCVVVAVNLDPHRVQACDFEIPLWAFGLPDDAAIEAVDLVSGTRFTWHGKVQHVTLDPASRPYAIWRLVPPGFAG